MSIFPLPVFEADADPHHRAELNDHLEAGAEKVLLTVPQPFSNHNGGQIAFAPDGRLWVGMGDGGSGGDPFNHGQNPGGGS